MSKSSVSRGEPSRRSATPPMTMKRTSCRTSTSISERARRAGGRTRRGEAPSSPSSLPRGTRGLLGRREELALLFERRKPLLRCHREHGRDQPLVVVVVRDELDLQVEPRRPNEALQRPESRLLATALDPGDLGLRGTRTLRQLPLAQVRTGASFTNDRPRGHGKMIAETSSLDWVRQLLEGAERRLLAAVSRHQAGLPAADRHVVLEQEPGEEVDARVRPRDQVGLAQ